MTCVRFRVRVRVFAHMYLSRLFCASMCMHARLVFYMYMHVCADGDPVLHVCPDPWWAGKVGGMYSTRAAGRKKNWAD